MSLRLAAKVAQRLQSEAAREGSYLAAWADDHALPTITLGQMSRDDPAGWPYIAVLSDRFQIDLRAGMATDATILLILGYLAPPGEDPTDALLAVDALTEASLRSLSIPWQVTWTRRDWVASYADGDYLSVEYPYFEYYIVVAFDKEGQTRR